ncbi:hypothetical protein MPSEU_000612700 [Mayamaea pseudoterrestris]|nr:hypothetical protein MPSEU_000612700 [Mayamaea pseudoterrestris]
MKLGNKQFAYLLSIAVMTCFQIHTAAALAPDESSCHDLFVTQSYCLESYGKCANTPCEAIQLPPDATCFHANYLFCKHQIPDCCCGAQMIEAAECHIPDCKIDCEFVVQASSIEECTGEGIALNSCWNSMDLGDCSQEEDCSAAMSLNVQLEASCEQLTEQICSANVPDCCCRQELISNAECNYAKQHGVECSVECASSSSVAEQGTDDGTEAPFANDDQVSPTRSPLRTTIDDASTQDRVSAAISTRLAERSALFTAGLALLLAMG